jgi:hypothetical protein
MTDAERIRELEAQLTEARAVLARLAALERVADKAREWAREHSESELAEAVDALDALDVTP